MSIPSELSFLPDDYFERKGRRQSNILCAALSAVVLGAIGSAFAVGERSMRQMDQRADEVDRQYVQASQQIDQVQKMYTNQRQIVQHAELAAALVEKVPPSNLLAEFTNALPAGASLLDLSMESKPRPTPPPAPGTAFDQKKAAMEGHPKTGPADAPPMDVFLKVTGVADNDVQVAQFITRLNASSLLKDVSLVVSDNFNFDKTAVRRFQIETMLKPDADVHGKTK